MTAMEGEEDEIAAAKRLAMAGKNMEELLRPIPTVEVWRDVIDGSLGIMPAMLAVYRDRPVTPLLHRSCAR